MLDDSHLESVPWHRTGPDRSHHWAWHSPDLRARIRVGMVLETYDCAYLRVKEIAEEGIVADGIEGPFLWTWETLERLECTIFSGDAGPDESP